MDIIKELEKNGIRPIQKLDFEEKKYITEMIADKLATNNKQLENEYGELYIKIINCEMYYAQIDSMFNGVFYFYKNNTIYFDQNRDIKNIDSLLIREIIHYIQNFTKITRSSTRAGLCKFLNFKIWGLGINEAVVQYIVAKSLNNQVHKVSNEMVSIYTNSENNYKFMTSLVNELLFFITDSMAVKSCILSNDEFENQLYNIFENSTEKIVKNFDIILEENNKGNKDENKIIKIYMQTQELIYTTYFINLLKRVNTIEEVRELLYKLEEFPKIKGEVFNSDIYNDEFSKFKDKQLNELYKKYSDISKKIDKTALAKIKKGKMFYLFENLTKYIQQKISKM